VDFQQELQNEIPAVNPLLDYGMRYHRECEDYDQTVCVNRNSRGIAIPQGEEVRLVNHNSIKVRKRLAGELVNAGLATPSNVAEKLKEAIDTAAYPFDLEWDGKRRK